MVGKRTTAPVATIDYSPHIIAIEDSWRWFRMIVDRVCSRKMNQQSKKMTNPINKTNFSWNCCPPRSFPVSNPPPGYFHFLSKCLQVKERVKLLSWEYLRFSNLKSRSQVHLSFCKRLKVPSTSAYGRKLAHLLLRKCSQSKSLHLVISTKTQSQKKKRNQRKSWPPNQM